MLNIKHEDFVFRISTREQSRCFHEHYEAGYEIDLSVTAIHARRSLEIVALI